MKVYIAVMQRKDNFMSYPIGVYDSVNGAKECCAIDAQNHTGPNAMHWIFVKDTHVIPYWLGEMRHDHDWGDPPNIFYTVHDMIVFGSLTVDNALNDVNNMIDNLPPPIKIATPNISDID